MKFDEPTQKDRRIEAPSKMSGDIFGKQRKSLAQGAYDRLLDMILTREIPSGTVLQERLLCTMLEVSRTPAREALYRLESEGFLTRTSGRGMVVKEISVRDIIEILHIRKLLEVESISLAVDRIQPAELDKTEISIRRLLASEKPDAAYDWAVDDEFHIMVARQSGNEHIVKMVIDLRMKTRIFNMNRVPERFRTGHLEHLEMIDAMRTGHRVEACHLMTMHLDHVKRSIMEKLSEI